MSLELNSSLANMPCQMPYAVPDGYFAGLAEDLAEGIHSSEAADPVLSFPKAIPFAVPDGYFTELAGNLKTRIEKSSIERGVASPYHVPAGYMNSLPDVLTLEVKKAVAPASGGKIIAFWSQWRRIGRVAAAAVLVLGLGFGTYSYFHSRQPEVTVRDRKS